jgi:hypothetical protein
MSRKSLFFGSIVLILAMLFALAGCKDPVAGPQGPQGDQGDQGKQGDSIQGDTGKTGSGGFSAGNISAVDLEDAFNDSGSGIVTLFSDVDSVYGKVPAGKTLKVLAEDAIVPVGRTLELEDGATLIIYKGAVLSAAALSVAPPGVQLQGSLTAEAGAKVEGEGAVVLPVDLSSDGSYTDTLHWGSSEITIPVERRYPGSYYGVPLGSGPGTPVIVRSLNSEAIARVFTEKNLGELTVQNARDLESNPALGTSAIPVGKKLTLVGTGNTITAANFTLLNNTRLTLAAGGELSIGNPGTNATIFQSNPDAVFTNEGTVNLLDNGAGTSSSIGTNGGTVTNNGLIWSTAEDVTVIVPLLALTGTGSVRLDSTADVTIVDAAPIPLNQYLVLGAERGGAPRVYTLGDTGGVARPFTGIAAYRTVTVEADVDLYLDEDVDSIGTTVYNSGTITTETLNTTVLSTIFTETGNRGSVIASGIVVDNNDDDGDVFKIPAGIELTLSDGDATLTNAGYEPKLIVEGTLIVSGTAEIAPSGDIDISGAVYLTGVGSKLIIADDKTLNISSSAVFDAGLGASVGTLEVEGGGGISTIIINGETGYSFEGTGVEGRNYATALAAINETRTILTDKVPLAGTSYTQWTATGVDKVVGTVDVALNVVAAIPPATVPPKAIAAGDPHPVYATNIGAGTTPITLPPGTTVDTTALASLPVGAVFTNADAFVLEGDDLGGTDTGYPWALKVQDNDYNAGGEKFAVIRYNSYQISNSNLKTPIVDHLFHIGVRSAR